jgi:hypothetical protein
MDILQMICSSLSLSSPLTFTLHPPLAITLLHPPSTLLPPLSLYRITRARQAKSKARQYQFYELVEKAKGRGPETAKIQISTPEEKERQKRLGGVVAEFKGTWCVCGKFETFLSLSESWTVCRARFASPDSSK